MKYIAALNVSHACHMLLLNYLYANLVIHVVSQCVVCIIDEYIFQYLIIIKNTYLSYIRSVFVCLFVGFPS